MKKTRLKDDKLTNISSNLTGRRSKGRSEEKKIGKKESQQPVKVIMKKVKREEPVFIAGPD